LRIIFLSFKELKIYCPKCRQIKHLTDIQLKKMEIKTPGK
jgi:hypothetical protein